MQAVRQAGQRVVELGPGRLVCHARQRSFQVRLRRVDTGLEHHQHRVQAQCDQHAAGAEHDDGHDMHR